MLEFTYDNSSFPFKGNRTYLRFETDQRPDRVRVVSSFTGRVHEFDLDRERTAEYYNQNEGWDGEYSCALYTGEVRDQLVTVELGCSPYFSE